MKTGIHHDVAAHDYHTDVGGPTLSSSIAKLLCNETPLHAWTHHPLLTRDYTREENERFDIGTAAHELLLGGEDRVTLLDFDDWRKKEAKELRDEARADGRLPLLAKDWLSVQTMCARLASQLDELETTPTPFTSGHPETVLVWEEPGGVVCRARLDWLRSDREAIDDYKTTSMSANPQQWSRNIFKRGYDVQAAFYMRGLYELTGASADFRFVVQETTAPHAVSVVSLGSDALVLARKKVDYAIDLWRRCLDEGEWPGYSTTPLRAQLPAWEEAQWLEKELAA